MRLKYYFGKASSVAAIAAMAMLASCAPQLKSSPRLIASNGLIQKADPLRDERARSSAITLDLRERFKSAAEVAAEEDATSDAFDLMVENGVLLARANCDDFFSRAGSLQRDADISRDLVAPIVTVLTGVVALRDFSEKKNDDFLQGIALGSGAILSGISIVDQHFLFGAENIKEVRDLTFDALAAHEEAISEIGAPSFNAGMRQLIDHQGICAPANILLLTRQAIAAGDVVADTVSSSAADEQALRALASTLDLVGSANTSQASALWNLYLSGTARANVPESLEQQLQDNGLGTLIVPSVPALDATDVSPAVPRQPASLSVTGAAKEAHIIAILKSFSTSTRKQLAAGEAEGAEGRSALDGFSEGMRSVRLRVQ